MKNKFGNEDGVRASRTLRANLSEFKLTSLGRSRNQRHYRDRYLFLGHICALPRK